MADADEASGKAEAIPLAKMIPTENMPLHEDSVHYNAEGQLKLGTAMAEAMQKLQLKKTSPTP